MHELRWEPLWVAELHAAHPLWRCLSTLNRPSLIHRLKVGHATLISLKILASFRQIACLDRYLVGILLLVLVSLIGCVTKRSQFPHG